MDKLAGGVRPPFDQVRTLYRTLLVYDTVAILILAVGVGEFIYFEPPVQTVGARARIVGVFEYVPEDNTTTGPDRSTFARDELFAAVVDWSSLPPDITVDARWYNSFGSIVGGVGPGTRSELKDTSIVPVRVPPGLHLNLPGHYIFVVERFQGGVPVEVLARRIVLVER